MKFLSFEMLKEKEIVVWLIDDRISATIAANLYEKLDLGGEGGGKVFLVPALAMGLKAPGVVNGAITGPNEAPEADGEETNTPT